jgi:hypothetical protein
MNPEIFFPAGMLARTRIPDELFDEVFGIKPKEESSEA